MRFPQIVLLVATPPLIVLASILHAQTYGPWSRMELAPGDDRCFARILVEDRSGTYNEDETLETSRGPVVVRYTTVGMHSGEPDYAEVVSVPDGVVALPMVLDLVPNEKRPICLMDGGVGM